MQAKEITLHKKCKKKNSIDRGHRLIYAMCPNHDIKTSFRVLIGT